MAATKVTTSTFNFASFNALTNSANSGLKLYLAIQMLQDVEATMRRFNSPFSAEIIAINDELAKLRSANKKYLEGRQASQEALKQDNTTSGALDNQHTEGAQHTNSADYAKEVA